VVIFQVCLGVASSEEAAPEAETTSKKRELLAIPRPGGWKDQGNGRTTDSWERQDITSS